MLYIAAALLVVCFCFVARAAGRAARPVSAGFWSAAGGLTALAAVNALESFTGVSIAVDYLTAACAVVLGAPGVVLMLAVRALERG